MNPSSDLPPGRAGRDVGDDAEDGAAVVAERIDGEVGEIGGQHVGLQQLRVEPVRPLQRAGTLGGHRLAERQLRSRHRRHVGRIEIAPQMLTHAGRRASSVSCVPRARPRIGESRGARHAPGRRRRGPSSRARRTRCSRSTAATTRAATDGGTRPIRSSLESGRASDRLSAARARCRAGR